MHAHEENRPSADRKAGRSPLPSADRLPPLLALQRTAGNAAVSRMLEQERHQHGAGCGHEQAAVQRSSVDEAVNSPGGPLSPRIRERAEQALGMDLGHVRVHSGPVAQRSAQELGARAYTTGADIVVGPQSVDDETMYHELRHVGQQAAGPVAGTDNGAGVKVSHESDPFEQDAARFGRELAAGNASDGPRAADSAGPGATASRASSVQRAPGSQSPERPSSRKSEGSERSAESAQSALTPADHAQLRFGLEANELWQRISAIKPLAQVPGFRAGVKEWLAAVQLDVTKAMRGDQDQNPPALDAVQKIMAGFRHKSVLGNMLQYTWFRRSQDKEGFDDILEARAQAAVEHGGVWSKMGAAVPIAEANVGRAVVLESSVQGYIFNGLLFGLPKWSDSPTMLALWKELSQSYAQGLKGWVTAHVLDGTTSTSVLNTTEWPELKKQIKAGQADGLNVVVYRSTPDPNGGRDILEPFEAFQVRTQDEFDRLPKAPEEGAEEFDAWATKQKRIDTQQKEALKEVYSREDEVDQLDEFVTHLFQQEGRDIKFKLTTTPYNTPASTFHGTPKGTFQGSPKRTPSPQAR